MRIKTVTALLLLFALLSLCMTVPVSAEDEIKGKYEMTASYTNTGDKIRYMHIWSDSMDEIWNSIDHTGGFRITEIKLYADWDVYEEKTLDYYNCHVVVDLNGHSIIRHTEDGSQIKNGGVFRISNDAHLQIDDSDPDSAGYDGIRGGVITGGANTNGGGAFTLTDRSKLTITGGTVYRCTTNEYGGAVMLKGTSVKHPEFKMAGGRIYFCQTTGAWSNSHGGAVYCDNGSVVLSNCRIDSCYSEDNGGAVYMNGGSLNAQNVLFTGNHCLDFGGAIFISGGSLRVARSRFSSNEAKKDGGAVYADSDEGAQFRDCIFNKNKSYGDGGALYVNDDRTYLIDTDVIANSASGYGGGVYVDSMDDIGVKGLVRIYNNSGKNGRNNLTLQDGFGTRALLSDGGLYEGSSIGLSSTGKNVKYAEDISVFQMGYFFSDSGDLVMEETYQREAPMLASVFSDGGAIPIVSAAALFLLFGAGTYAVLAKKKKAGEEKKNEKSA